MDDLPIVEVNQRLNFDEMSCDEEEDSSETGSGATISTNNSGKNFLQVFQDKIPV